jgi:hypothetical protein
MGTTNNHYRVENSITEAQRIWRRMSSEYCINISKTLRERRVLLMQQSKNYFRIIVRPEDKYKSFRHKDIGAQGRIIRVSGRKNSGSWDTQAWLISKDYAYQEDEKLIAESDEVRDLFEGFSGPPKRLEGDTYGIAGPP